MKGFYVFIAADAQRRVFEVGFTAQDLQQKFIQLKQHFACKPIKVDEIVYADFFSCREQASRRYQELKKINQKAKKSLIKRTNPYQEDVVERTGAFLVL